MLQIFAVILSETSVKNNEFLEKGRVVPDPKKNVAELEKYTTTDTMTI